MTRKAHFTIDFEMEEEQYTWWKLPEYRRKAIIAQAESTFLLTFQKELSKAILRADAEARR